MLHHLPVNLYGAIQLRGCQSCSSFSAAAAKVAQSQDCVFVFGSQSYRYAALRLGSREGQWLRWDHSRATQPVHVASCNSGLRSVVRKPMGWSGGTNEIQGDTRYPPSTRPCLDTPGARPTHWPRYLFVTHKELPGRRSDWNPSPETLR